MLLLMVDLCPDEAGRMASEAKSYVKEKAEEAKEATEEAGEVLSHKAQRAKRAAEEAKEDRRAAKDDVDKEEAIASECVCHDV
jgi:hypothetical protein